MGPIITAIEIPHRKVPRPVKFAVVGRKPGETKRWCASTDDTLDEAINTAENVFGCIEYQIFRLPGSEEQP